jgi:hypothetical protein
MTRSGKRDGNRARTTAASESVAVTRKQEPAALERELNRAAHEVSDGYASRAVGVGSAGGSNSASHSDRAGGMLAQIRETMRAAALNAQMAPRPLKENWEK